MHVSQRVKALSLLLLINCTIFAGEKDFRGWKEGDYIMAVTVLDMEWEKNFLEDASRRDLRVHPEWIYGRPKENTVWCKIEAASGDYLLVTGYYSSQRTLGQYNRGEIRHTEKMEPPRKFNLICSTNLHLEEWQKNAEPPRPKVSWWHLFNK